MVCERGLLPLVLLVPDLLDPQRGRGRDNQVTRRLRTELLATYPGELPPANPALRRCPKVADHLSRSCSVSRGLAQSRPMLRDLGQHFPEFGQRLADFGQVLAEFWPKAAELGPTWPSFTEAGNIRQLLAEVGYPWWMLVRCLPTSANARLANVGQFWSSLAKAWPNLNQSKVAKAWPNLADIGKTLAPFGQFWSNSSRPSAPGATARQLWGNFSATLGQLRNWVR